MNTTFEQDLEAALTRHAYPERTGMSSEVLARILSTTANLYIQNFSPKKVTFLLVTSGLTDMNSVVQFFEASYIKLQKEKTPRAMKLTIPFATTDLEVELRASFPPTGMERYDAVACFSLKDPSLWGVSYEACTARVRSDGPVGIFVNAGLYANEIRSFISGLVGDDA